MAKAAVQIATEPRFNPEVLLCTAPSSLAADKSTIETYLATLLAKGLDEALSPVPKAMEYAVLGAGQRYRPILALRVARMLGAETEAVLRAAAAVELLHSASLIIDDLPCMDDELLRRGRPTVHRQFGEPTAILAAFSMVALSARIVMETPAPAEESQRLRRFQLALLRTLDVSSLVGGQAMDLALVGEERDAKRAAVNDLKTVPLFQLAVEAGLVSYAGARPAELDSFGRLFGVAFQLTDDYLDGELSDQETLNQTYEHCRSCLQPFGANAGPLCELLDHLSARTR